MKTIIAGVMMVSLAVVSGCWTTESRKGGTRPQEREFTIMVPTRESIKQGTTETVIVKLDRDAYFKRDVQLEIQAEGIDVTPNSVLIKASALPEVELQIAVASDAALGKYRVTVKGTPTSGTPTEATFTVKVVEP